MPAHLSLKNLPKKMGCNSFSELTAQRSKTRFLCSLLSLRLADRSLMTRRVSLSGSRIGSVVFGDGLNDVTM